MSLPVQKIEQALLVGQWDDTIQTSASHVSRLAQNVLNAEFKHVLTSPSAETMLRLRISGDDLISSPLESWFSFGGLDNTSEENELLRLVLGVACLHAFLQVNWTGPDLDIVPADVLFKPDTDSLAEDTLNQKAVAELACGGEPAYHLARAATFLRLAQLLFDAPLAACPSAPWWRMRAARVHQHILDEPAAAPAPAADLAPLFADARDLAGRLALERGLLAHGAGQDRAARGEFVRAARHTGLEYALTGALGRRTRFQQTALSQLVLLAESRGRAGGGGGAGGGQGAAAAVRDGEGDGGADPEPGCALPDTLALNDDTLLEQTAFTSSPSAGGTDSKLAHLDPAAQPPLHPLDQCILLALCLNVKNTSPAHGLTTEQMAPYVARVLAHPQNWSVHTMALLLRSRLEAARTRTVERATLQLQALVDQLPAAAAAPPAERLRLVHALPLPSRWALERELAQRLLALGAVRSALAVFERLEMWEEAVRCWQALGRPAAGLAIVRDLLAGRKEEAARAVLRAKTGAAVSARRRHALDRARAAKLWCLLGELEPAHALEHYARAWTVSEETSGRAMRAMGGCYFASGEFARAIECLRKAVAISPLLSRPWFILGCSCVREERWEEARDAFARCVAIDDEDGESWSNLASVYLRMGTSGTRKKDDDDSEEQAGFHLQKQCKIKGASDTENTAPPPPPPESIPFENKLLAFRALKVGLKHSYDNWRMWTNYMVIAMDVGEYAEAARAQARVVEERAAKVGAGAVDEDLLDRLVDAVTRAPADAAGPAAADPRATPSPNDGAGLRPRVLDLFERVLLPRVASPRVYRAYARLLAAAQTRWGDVVRYYLEAYRLGAAAGGEVDRARWLGALGELEELVDVLRSFGGRAEAGEEGGAAGEEAPVPRTGRWRMQARSVVRTFVARTRDGFGDDPEWARVDRLRDEVKK